MSGLPEPGTAERRWLEARAGAVRRRVDQAPEAWRAWAVAALYADAIGTELGQVPAGEGTDGAWDQVRGRALRASLGQVFTPPELARALASVLPLDRPGTVLDPACGAGSLLVAALESRRRAGWSVADALGSVEGWDRDPVAAWLCRARLVEWALSAGPRGPVPGPLRIHAADALDPRGRAGQLSGVTALIGNPPYLEAKRMGAAEPGLKERLRERFPQLSGAFDLYLAFAWLALELVEPGGEVALLVPNKVCQGRYAAGFREALLEPGEPALRSLIDLSRASPRPFPGTSVYPVILHLAAAAPTGPVRMRRVMRPADLPASDWQEVERESLRSVGGEHPIFTPFATWPALAPLFALERLGEVAHLASTCSFHKKGLRERFVFPDRPHDDARPYLGLHSRARRTEVAPFRVRWEGGWIDHDNERLKREFRNPLPPLSTFERPKVLWCQHALRMRAVADPEGRWVSKDTYPVGWPTDPRWTLDLLVAVLNSTVFTALYNTVYQGIVVGGETYHYLPAFLRHVPVPRADHPALAEVDRLVGRVGTEGPVDRDAWLALDRAVAEAYGVSEAARRHLAEVHLERVGAETPG